MTVEEYRKELTKVPVQCFGMEWRLFEDDLVRIIAQNDIHEIKFKNFIDLSNSLGLSDNFKNEEITDIKITKDEHLSHTMILFIDIRPKEHKNKIEGGISARMKYM